MATMVFRVWGFDGHRQRESFSNSYIDDFSRNGKTRVIEVFNSDKTGTNDYTIVSISRNTIEECFDEIDGQLSDGIFENSRTGLVEFFNETIQDWQDLNDKGI